MKRALLRSNTFVRAAKSFIKRHPHCKDDLQDTLLLLSEDAFNPKLKTHKLKGDLLGSWACSVGYDLRIIFEFVDFENTEAILLQTLGSHDEVY